MLISAPSSLERGEDDGAEAGGNGEAEGGREGDGGVGFIAFALGVEGLVVGGVAGRDGFLWSALSGEDGDGFRVMSLVGKEPGRRRGMAGVKRCGCRGRGGSRRNAACRSRRRS